MKYNGKKAEQIKIAYVGGGSRGWAWGLMSDLAGCDDISGDVYLYDIDFEAAKNNEIIGNKFNELENAKSTWNYHAVETAKAIGVKTLSLTGAKESRLSELSDVTVRVPETETFMIQELHLPVYHYLCAATEKHFFEK